MSISRVTKSVVVLSDSSTFEKSKDARIVDIDIFLPDSISETICQMAQCAVALALRSVLGKIRIHCPHLDTHLRSVLQSEAVKFGEPERLDLDSNSNGKFKLALGLIVDGAVSADASGWTARVNGVFSNNVNASSPAATFAVACAFGKLFNHAILGRNEHFDESWDFCLLRFLLGQHPVLPVVGTQNLGRVALLGAGAIGSAFSYVLSLSAWSGELHIIDFDRFEDSNIETCIFADRRSVNVPLLKAQSLVNNFRDHRMYAQERNEKIRGCEPLLTEQWGALICAVDNPETRCLLDHVNAPVILNAGLGSTKLDAGWVLWTRHGSNNPTLSSIYTPQVGVVEDADIHVPEEFQEQCSRLNYNNISLSLPFVAVAAGSLLAASLFQHSIGKMTSHTWMQMDLLKKQSRITFK